MLIRFNQQHLSITSFNPVNLPELTVLTGVNGSGKTHLLEAIQNRSISVDGIRPNSIITFNYETFRLENESPFSAHDIAQEKQSAFNFFESNVRGSLQSWKGFIANDFDVLKQEAKNKKTSYWNIQNSQPLETYKSQVTALFDQPHIKGQQHAGPLLSLIKSHPETLDTITKYKFYSTYKPVMFKNDFLPQAIGRVIWDYYIKFTQNNYNLFRNNTQNTSLPYLSDEEFIEQNGEKPWIVINRILKQFDSLEYEVSSPDGLDIFNPYHLKLQNIHNQNLKIDFSSLSSGERVLMALVASVYKSASDNNFPDLLLLDELDATLHPSMMKNMIAVVNDVFVARGTKVILVTHSPSTVAFAPESSIFVMNKRGVNRVEKRSKKDALSILTEGFATLEEGMLLFDQVAGGKCSIITEGRNTQLLARALKQYSVNGINIIDGLEALSGKNQLKTLFDFMCKIPHKNKIIFIWDCDVNYNLAAANSTHPIIMTRNQANQLAKSGIENMFPEELFAGFTKTITPSRGPAIVEFDEQRKKDFEEYVLSRNDPSDFQNFSSLVDQIKRIRDADEVQSPDEHLQEGSPAEAAAEPTPSQ